MRYTTKQYAIALFDAISSTKDTRATALHFISVLRRHKTLKRLPEILEIARTFERLSRGGRKISITAADESAIQEATKPFSEKDDVQTTIDKNIVGGISITVDGIRFDNTLRRRFNDLQKTLTK